MNDLKINLPNKVGALAELGNAMGATGVNIGGICGSSSNGDGVFHLLVEDVTAARQAVARSGGTVEDEREVVMWKYGGQGAVGKPGSLGEVCQKLADAGIDIDLIYQGENDTVIFGVDKIDEARMLIE